MALVCTFKLLASFLEFFAGVPLSPLKQWPSMVEDQLVSAAISNNLKMVGESVVIRIWAMLKCLVSQSQKSLQTMMESSVSLTLLQQCLQLKIIS